jgi:acyl-CoA synthetase (AMP-forming)/AMP-acid ligase II
MLPGLMQDRPLLISSLLAYAERFHPQREVVSRFADGTEQRLGWGDVGGRARQIASALTRAGVRPGDRVATLAMNHHRHIELYYGVSGIGAVLHTVNPRLFEPQLAYVLRHGGARWIFVDPAFLPLLGRIGTEIPELLHRIVLAPSGEVPRGESGYEEFLATGTQDVDWPTFDERAASALCYTSGTTGNPKGVLYSHRSTVLHALAACRPDSFDVSARSVLLAIPPLFHANAWSFPYIAAMAGAKLVLPGPRLDGASLQALIESEGCTFTVGVPTVFTGLLDHLRATNTTISPLRRAGIGGSAVPRAMIEAFAAHGCEVLQLWGMTEVSPLGTIATPTAETDGLPDAARREVLARQGRVRWGLDVRLVREDGSETPADGRTPGALWVRGPWAARGYFGEPAPVTDRCGWLPTGDVATLDGLGFLQITDRTKDLIKSGGEWISSLEIENTACSMPGVRHAAVVATRHPRWEERPLLLIVPELGVSDAPTPAAVVDYLRPLIAKWWLPDAVLVVEELPLTATGKVDKKVLRERYGEHLIRDATLTAATKDVANDALGRV